MADDRVPPLGLAEKPPLSRLAISSAILGFLSVAILPMTFVIMALYNRAHMLPGDIRFMPGIMSVAAALTGLVLGVAAYWEIARSGGRLRGKGLALTGALVSLGLLLLVFGFLVFLAIGLRDFPHPS